MANDPVNGFTTAGNRLEQENLGLGLTLSLPFGKNWGISAGYNVLLGANTTSQQVLLKIMLIF